MKINKIRVVSFLLILALVLSNFIGLTPVQVLAEESSETTLVKIHYKRADGDYAKWNLWVWDKANNGEGTAYPFTGQDDKGVYAVIELPKTAAVGFIVRTDAWDKDTGDVILDTSKGNREAFVVSGQESIEQKDLTASFKKVTLNLHYHRFEGNYEGWNVWLWHEGKEAAAYEFNGEDSYGKVASYTFESAKPISRVGVSLKKDIEDDRFIDLAFADSNGNIDVYLIEGNKSVYYSEKQVVKTKEITKARMDSIRQISFQANVPLDKTNNIELFAGTDKVEAVAKLNKDGKGGVLEASKDFDISKKYMIKIANYKGGDVTLGGVLGSEAFKNLYHYDGELGAIYSKRKTTFKVWAPTADSVTLRLFNKGLGGALLEAIPMEKGDKGVWSVTKKGNLEGTFYTYAIKVNGVENETQDVYSKAVGANGKRSMVVDLSKTNPEGWKKSKGPELKNPTDAVIYELHVRDISRDKNSGIKMKGKFLGLTEKGTKSAEGEATGIDHLKEMGVTHVHLLPSYDFSSVDETKLEMNEFNWGYDPKNYQVPEGSYSTDPYSGSLRISEMKQMIKELHDAGIGVIMDSVYNHTYTHIGSAFDYTVPNYYYRYDESGKIIGTSGVGNDTASERSMFRKYMIDSVVYWANEYKIDGFRFDLMGIHDIETMNAIREAVDKINPQILMYGEGWNMGGPIPENDRAIKAKVNLQKMNPRIAVFSDDMRDGVKGHVFNTESGGFVNFNGKWSTRENLKEIVKFGIVASTQHEGVNYELANYTEGGAWASQPTQTVNYVSAHDNNTLWDKLAITNPNANEEERIKMDKMANFLVLTSQGIPFIQAGEEMLRTKPSATPSAENPADRYDHNSYKSPDSVNALDWSRKAKYKDVVEYYKGLIALRKAHPAFRMATTAEIQKNLKFIDTNDTSIAYTISNNANGDSWKDIAVIANAGEEAVEITLPTENWTVVVDGNKAGTVGIKTIQGNKVTVEAGTSMVLADTLSFSKPFAPAKSGKAGMITAGLAVLIAAAGAVYFIRARRKA